MKIILILVIILSIYNSEIIKLFEKNEDFIVDNKIKTKRNLSQLGINKFKILFKDKINEKYMNYIESEFNKKEIYNNLNQKIFNLQNDEYKTSIIFFDHQKCVYSDCCKN